LLVALALSLALGIWVADVVGFPERSAWALAIAGLALALARARRAVGRRIVGAVLVVFAAGGLLLGNRLSAAESAARVESGERTIEARICGRRDGYLWAVAELCEVRGVDAGDPLPRRLQLEDLVKLDAVERVLPGQSLRLRVRVRPIRGLHNPGGLDRERAAARRGLGLRARAVDPLLRVRLERGTPPGIAHGLARARARVAASLGSGSPGSGLLRALVVADRSGISPVDKRALRRLGLSHLIAISGLHLAVVAGFAFGLGEAAFRRLSWITVRWDSRTPAVLLAAATALLYAGLCGFGLPVRRALVFVLALALSWGLGRRLPVRNVLSAAGIAILLDAPEALFDPGAQLSFAASAALLTARRTPPGGSEDPAPRRAAVIASFFAAGLRTTALAAVATAPILAAHGTVAPVVGLGANALAVPFVAGLLLPLALGTAALAIAADGIGVGSLAAPVVAGVAALAAAAMRAAAGAADGLPALADAAPAASWAVDAAAKKRRRRAPSAHRVPRRRSRGCDPRRG